MKYKVRLIEEQDNVELENILQAYLIENNNNFDYSNLSSLYKELKTAYFVVLDENNNIIGGCGVGKIYENDDYCQLQHFYIKESFRETSAPVDLLRMCIMFATEYYNVVYMEIFDNMNYLKNTLEEQGFLKINEIAVKKINNTFNDLYIYKIKKQHWIISLLLEFFKEIIGLIILIGMGLLTLLIFPKKITENVDFEVLIFIGSIIFIGVLILISLLIEFIRKKKGMIIC